MQIGNSLCTELSVMSHEYDFSVSGYISMLVVSGRWCRQCEAVFQGQD